MLDRRTLFGVSGTSFLASLLGGRKAHAKSAPFDVEPRGANGRMERLPTLELESRQDFYAGFRTWVNGDMRQAAVDRMFAIMKDMDMEWEDDLPLDEVLEIAEEDPQMRMFVRAWVSGQQLTWKSIRDEFHRQADVYLAEMEAADKAGPGTLELNPDLKVPDYAKHEIHIQPGGYVGDPFAGHINHYGVNVFYAGKNYQDEVQGSIASKVLIPEDGKVKRILDLGCATGRLTYAMKERFPEAEVWGIDVGGPMVRYAHLRGIDLGLDVNFAQRLAEDTKFPDQHFDLVVSYIMFHEMPAKIADVALAETFRILRPGGVFFPVDFGTGAQAPEMNAYRRFSLWWDHRWNNEVWRPEHGNRDFGAAIRKMGFEVDETIEPARRGHGAILATRPA